MKKFAVGLLLLSGFASPNAITADELAPTVVRACDSPRRAVSRSYIQAVPGQKERLKTFIKANFFAIDALAVQQGLMYSYALLEKVDSSDPRPWDLMLVDAWCDEHGLEVVAGLFTKITEAHQTVPIDGMFFDDLGTFIGSESVIEEDVPDN